MTVRDFLEILFAVVLSLLVEAVYQDYLWTKRKIANLREKSENQ